MPWKTVPFMKKIRMPEVNSEENKIEEELDTDSKDDDP